MDSRIIQLTAAAHKYGNLNIRSCGKEFFPPDAFGGTSKKKGLGVLITIEAQGLPPLNIKNDIDLLKMNPWDNCIQQKLT